MQVSVEEVQGLTRRVKIVVPAEVAGKELNAVYNKMKSQVNLKGFRKGKVPRHVLEQAYKPQAEAEAGEKLIQATYFDAIEQEKLDVVVHPDIKAVKFEEDGSFAYEVEVDLRPQFELKEYKGLAIDKPATVVTDEEVEAELLRMQREAAPLKSVEDRASRMDDVLVIDCQGYDGSEPIKNLGGRNLTVDLGSGRNGKEFEEKLVGLEKGQETGFDLSYGPENQNPLLAGRTVRFQVTVNEIKERILPALDDEFAKDAGEEFASIEALRQHIREARLAAKEKDLDGVLFDKIMQKLIEENQFEVPARLVQFEIDEYIKENEAILERSGLTLESAGINRDEVAGRYREVAEKRVRGDFILKKISEQEALKVTDEDLDAGFGRISKQYNMTVNEVKGYFQRREDIMPFMNELLNEKVLAFLRDNASFTAVAAEEAAAEEPAAETAE